MREGSMIIFSRYHSDLDIKNNQLLTRKTFNQFLESIQFSLIKLNKQTNMQVTDAVVL